MNNISIIIPTLNEKETIEKLLSTLDENAFDKDLLEIIIVDGGSSDGTIKILEQRTEIILLKSKKGRAKQLNTGAAAAQGSILYFIHADSLPPKHFDSMIINEVKNGNFAGCFRLKFDSKHWWLILAGWFTRFNWSICRGGDQSLFITKALFHQLGGYDESFEIYEDNVLINQLYKKKQFVVIPAHITTSARLYIKHGIWKLQYHFWRIHLMHYLGAKAQDIHQYYKKNIAT